MPKFKNSYPRLHWGTVIKSTYPKIHQSLVKMFAAMDEGYSGSTKYDRLYAKDREEIFFQEEKKRGLSDILGDKWVIISTADYPPTSDFWIRVSLEKPLILLEFKALDFVIEMDEDLCVEQSWDFMKFLVNFLRDSFCWEDSELYCYVVGGDNEYHSVGWDWDKILKELAPMLPFEESDELHYQAGKSATNIYVPDWSRKALTLPIPYDLRKILERRAVIPKDVKLLVHNLPPNSTVETLTEDGVFRGQVSLGRQNILNGLTIYKFTSEDGKTQNITEEQILKIHHLNVPTPGVFKKRSNLVI